MDKNNSTNNPHPLQSPSKSLQNRLMAERRGTVARLRIVQGVKGLAVRPWTIVTVLPLLVAALLVWLNRTRLLALLPPGFAALPGMLAQAATIAGYAIGAVVLLLLLALVLTALGTPHYARRIERGLAEIFRNGVGFGRWPVYVSRQRVKNTEYYAYTFYSQYIPISVWNERRENVALMLRGHVVGDIEYKANDRRYIVVHAGPGAVPTPNAAPVDPIFK